MKNSKRTLAILLAVVMMFGMMNMAMAENDNGDGTIDYTDHLKVHMPGSGATNVVLRYNDGTSITEYVLEAQGSQFETTFKGERDTVGFIHENVMNSEFLVDGVQYTLTTHGNGNSNKPDEGTLNYWLGNPIVEEPTTGTIQVTKVTEGLILTSSQAFTFDVYAEATCAGTPVDTITVTLQNGQITGSAASKGLDAGTYYVKENTGAVATIGGFTLKSVTTAGGTYDEATQAVAMEVVVGEQALVTFTNAYEGKIIIPEGEALLSVTKTVAGIIDETQYPLTFDFTLEVWDAELNEYGEKVPFELTVNSLGVASTPYVLSSQPIGTKVRVTEVSTGDIGTFVFATLAEQITQEITLVEGENTINVANVYTTDTTVLRGGGNRIPLGGVEGAEEIPLGPPMTGESVAYGWALLLMALAVALSIISVRARNAAKN